MMPIVKKLNTYARKPAPFSESRCASDSLPGGATARFSTSKVIATAKTPSLNASRRPRSMTRADRLGEAGDELGHRLATSGEERDLHPGVPARLRAAQVTHQVHDAVQFVGLEREYPLEVVQREAADRIRAHVRVLAGHHAVLGEHLPALGRVEQVPLVGPDEGVHAHVVARFLLGE